MSKIKISLNINNIKKYFPDDIKDDEIQKVVDELNIVFTFINLQLNNTKYSHGVNEDGKIIKTEVVTWANKYSLIILEKFLNDKKSSCCVIHRQKFIYPDIVINETMVFSNIRISEFKEFLINN